MAENWQEKYNDVVEQFKEKSALYKSMVEQLRDNLAKISIAGNGFDTELDRKLASLRREIRVGSGQEIIQNHVDDVTKTIRIVDEKKNLSQSILARAVSNLLEPLEGVTLPPALSAQSKKLKAKLANESADDPSDVINEFSTLFRSLIENMNNAPVAKASSSSSGGFLGRLMGGDAVTLDKHVSELLDELLTHLRLPAELNKDIENVKGSIHDGLSVDELEAIVEQITSLVVQAFNLEQDKMKDFLESMTDRLGDMQNFLSDSLSDNEEAKLNSDSLDKSVKQEIEKIQGGMKDNVSLDALTQMLDSSLENISSNITQFREKESERMAKSQERISSLESELQKSESQTAQLKESLSAQRHRAQHDTLTGLPNRETYNEFLDQAINRWNRGYGDLCLGVADIDFFKKINDNYGHLAGDKVLKKVAAMLKANLRSVDFIARYGGEEFVVILEKTSVDDAEKVLNKLRAAIEECKFHFRETQVPVTISFGLTQFGKEDNGDTAFSRADEALYVSKEKGRNQVQIK